MPITDPTLLARTGLILLAAGQGSRFGRDKIWADLGGRPLIAWSLTTLLDLKPAALIVVYGDHEPSAFEGLDPRSFALAKGGATRRASVLAGLAALPEGIERVLIHDGARPGVTREIVLDVAQALQSAAVALPTVPVIDTIKQQDARGLKTLERSRLHAAQTPQGFDLKILNEILQTAQADQTDEVQALEAAGHQPTLVPGAQENMKVTQPDDMILAHALLCPDTAKTITVTGQGFDVHKFCAPGTAKDRPLKLGGLKIPGAPPLAGHSDADVLLHALCDAIYGGLGDGDIGYHFPPSDDQWKDRDSRHFLSHSLEQLSARGGQLLHMDLTLICEIPKLRPVYKDMKACLADLTGLPETRIGLKATTTEGLGFPGRKEGIAAQAVVTLRLPA